MKIDTGILTGVTGAILATISLIYARSQAHAQRRQVEEMERQTEETRRAQHFEASHALMNDAIAARQARAVNFRKVWAPPSIGAPLERSIFESFAEMGRVTPEFAKFGPEYAASGIWKDPLGRLEAIQLCRSRRRHPISSTR